MSFTGINGASIFLPFSGYFVGKELYGKDRYCVYRTGIPASLLGTLTYYLYIDNEDIVYWDYLGRNGYYRYHGMPIRPVMGNNAPVQPSITITPTKIDFGVVKFGTDKTEELTVRNIDNTNVTVTMDGCISSRSNFDVSNNQEEVTLAPGESKVYTVTAHSTKAGNAPTQLLLLKCESLDKDIEVEMSSYGDDDDPIINVTDLLMNVGEIALVKVKDSGCFSAIPDDENIIKLSGGGDPGTSGGPIDPHSPMSNYSETEMTIKALKVGVTHITFTDMHTNHTSMLTITVNGLSPIPRTYIDLGLPSGTKWANMNVGASRPEEYGNYFAWGEALPKDSYSWENYMCPESTCGKSGDPVFDFVGDKADIAGTSFDAATVNWGTSWKMPTAKQVEELASNCYSSLETVNGVLCRKLTSRINGNKIIFPLAGARWFEDFAYEGTLCYYWSSTLRAEGYVSPGRLIVEDDRHGWGWSMGGENDRFCGFPIRAVMGAVAEPNLTLGTKVLMLTKGESVGLTYYAPADADLSAMTWTTNNSAIATVDNDGVVTAVSEGSCTITVSCGILGQQECRVFVDNVTGTSSGHEYIDLGLPSGTLWATTNVGAETPDETGNLLSWVDTEGDAALASWGAYWRMPAREQLEELIAGTSMVYTSLNDTEGFLLTSKTNGKCIFLPITNSTSIPLRGCYWSGTSDGGSTAYALNITSAAADVLTVDASEHLAVRPVYDESVAEGSTFTVSAGDLDFGSVAVGSLRSMSFDIHNNTFGLLNVKPFGIDADDFFVDWTGGEIQPNATQPVTVTYSPTKETIAAGGSLLIATAIDSSFVNVSATSHKGSNELTSKANLVVWCKNGAKVSFLLNDKPIVKIKDGKWIIDCKKAVVEYDVVDVVKMTYDGILDDIPAIDVGTEKPFAFDAETLTFLSDSEDLHVRIVATSGIVVRQFVARCGTAFSVPLNQFAPGVYIVTVNNISYKISIR